MGLSKDRIGEAAAVVTFEELKAAFVALCDKYFVEQKDAPTDSVSRRAWEVYVKLGGFE